MPHRRHRLVHGMAALAGCIALASVSIGASAQTEEPAATQAMVELKVGLGYIPSVQFAQFYRAEQAGYYDEAGLDVSFQHMDDPELITLLAQGAIDIGMADGTSLIPAVSRDIPLVYGATIYAQDPNVVFSLATAQIESAADLAGRRIGIPGRFGSSWIALQALLQTAGLSPDDVDIVTYPNYTQRAAVEQGQVDAATGFVTNEPVQLRLQGTDVNVLRVSDVAPLPGPGLVTGRETLAGKQEALRAFAQATIRAMEEIAADPQLGLDATFAHIPELASDPETQRAILEATIGAWTSEHTAEYGMGRVDREVWRSGIEIMSSLPEPLVAAPVTIEDLVTDELLP